MMICNAYANPKEAVCDLELWELNGSRERRESSSGVQWILLFGLRGTIDECLVHTRLQHQTLGIPRLVHQQELKDYSIRHLGSGVWQIEAIYGYYGVLRPTDSAAPTRISTSTGGGTEHIQKAMGRGWRSADCPDEKLFVGWDGKGEVAGQDIPTSHTVSRMTYRLTRQELYAWPGAIYGNLSADLLGTGTADDYWGIKQYPLIRRYELMVGAVHGYDWVLQAEHDDWYDRWSHARGFWHVWQQGDVMFLGAIVDQVDEQDFDVTLEFEIRGGRWVDIPPDVNHSSESSVPRIREHPRVGGEYQIFVCGFETFEVHYYNKDEDPGDGQGEAIIPFAKHARLLQVPRFIPFQFLGVPNAHWSAGSSAANWFKAPCSTTPLGEMPNRYALEQSYCAQS